MDKIRKNTKINKILRLDPSFYTLFENLGIKNINIYKDSTVLNLAANENLNLEKVLKYLNDGLKTVTISAKYQIFEWCKVIFLAFLLAFTLTQFIVVNAIVPTESMENTINIGDRIIAFRFSYSFDNPERGDIVVFKNPDNKEELYLKRIIGLPGETINIINGKVFINNSEFPLEESYLKEIMKGSFGPYIVPMDSYFVMGDNRNNSEDSRFWNNTFVEKDDILGKCIFRYYPKIEFFNK